MKHLKFLTAGLFCSFLFLIGCKKEIQSDETVSSTTLLNEKTVATQSSPLSAELKEKLKQLRANLPADYEKRLQINSSLLLKRHPQYRNLVLRAMKAIEPTECDDNTAVSQWLNNELTDWDSDVVFFAVLTGMLDFPTYDALLFVNSSDNQYYGINGEFSHSNAKGFKDLKRFWNIETNGMVIGAMHGNMLLDREKVIRTDMAVYGDSRSAAEYWADLILSLMQDIPQYRKGNHPIFTFNAFALSGFSFPPYGNIPNKIIMGDGIQHGFSAVGYQDVAPQAILAHEFGHHIQFQLGLFGEESSPEATRRTELMADAYAAYYLSHARGASMQWKRVKQFMQVFFNIGDCGFTNENHHGTPAQRLAAAEWGYSIANDAQKQGHILTSQEFASLFEKKLPELINH